MAFDGRTYCTKRHAYNNAHPAAPAGRVEKSKAMLPRPVEIDPERPGSASSLLAACDKVDAAAVRFTIEMTLSQAEIDQVLDRLGPAQRQAFLSAGLRAALLA
jgi:hypothetical protein